MKSAILLTSLVLLCILHDAHGRDLPWKKKKVFVDEGPNKFSPVIFSEFAVFFLSRFFFFFLFFLSFFLSIVYLHCVSFTPSVMFAFKIRLMRESTQSCIAVLVWLWLSCNSQIWSRTLYCYRNCTANSIVAYAAANNRNCVWFADWI